MKIALVHDYLNEFGGAERVLKVLSDMYPDAPIYTAFKVKGSNAEKAFADKKIIESWFAKIPFGHRLISPLRFLLPLVWRSFNFSEYDVVITSAAWAVTKGMRKGNKTKEICYLHTPPRWLYGYDESRSWRNKWYGWAVKFYALIVGHFLRMYDFKQSQKVDYFIVNSKNVGKRVEKFYRRYDYKVIYPPIDIEKYRPLRVAPLKVSGDYYLTGGRMSASKNFDLIIKACEKAKVKLKIYGEGILENELKRISSDGVEFLSRISDEDLIRYYANAKAFIAAQKDEDFGMTLIEAAAAGTPSIAYNGGGYVESVVDGKTGILFDELTIQSLVSAIKKFEKKKWNKLVIRRHAEKFSRKVFENKIEKLVAKSIK